METTTVYVPRRRKLMDERFTNEELLAMMPEHKRVDREYMKGAIDFIMEKMQRIAEQVRTDRLWPTSETAWQMRRDDIRPVSCHDCPHWQDGDGGPQCEYPDCPPCNGE